MKITRRMMDLFIYYILSTVFICTAAAAEGDDSLGGNTWWLWLSVSLVALIALIIGGFLYRRKLHKPIPGDEENTRKDEHQHSTNQKGNSTSTTVLNSHSNITQQNNINFSKCKNYGATKDDQLEKYGTTNLSESSSQEDKSPNASLTLYSSSSSSSPSLSEDNRTNREQLSDKEIEDVVDSLFDRAQFEDESLYGTAHKSSRYRLLGATPEDEDGNNNDEDLDNSDDLQYVNITHISRASLKQKIEQYIAGADGSSTKTLKQELGEDILHVDGSGRYLLNKDILHLSDLGNHSITSTKQRESLNLSQIHGSKESLEADQSITSNK